ncbi:MAG: elongation factor G [Chloroflexota bacterium]|nr:elongation factor G [Chloroflexota bacterium]MDE2968843.1 elongation factor G [Chloroflexota bacterium]
MGPFSTDKLRNVVMLSHSGAGKTSLAEAMLFTSGSISRMGKTEEGTTTGDYEPEAVKRTSSTQLSILPCAWNGHKVTLLDSPGYFDFIGDALSSMRVADAAVLVVAAGSGVEVGTEQMWSALRRQGLPCIIVVNKLDRENTDFMATVEELRNTLGRECFALQVPVGQDHNFKSVVNILPAPAEIPAEAQDAYEQAREALIESIAETDDDLATKWLEEGTLTDDEMLEPLRRAVINGTAVPVLAASATQSVGAAEALDAIVALAPSPLEAQNPVEADAALAALAFKTSADPYVGKLTYLKVYSGTLNSNTEVYNAAKERSERLGQLFVPMGKNQEQVASLVAGEIGAVGRLAETTTGDTLSTRDAAAQIVGIDFPAPIYTMAVYPKTKGDTDKMGSALARLAEEDPSLHFVRDQSTSESLLSGMGDAHLDVMVQRAQRKFGVNLLLQTPKVPYRETIGGTTRVEHRHKQQSGGHGHFAHILLRVEPTDGSPEGEFATEVVGGSVPKEFIPAVEKGVRRAWAEGIVAGFPVVDTKAVLYDGSYHPVDSASMDFETCGYFAMKKAFAEGSPVLLEPIMLLRVNTPDAYTGELIGDLNSKRGRILGMIPQDDGRTVVEANVPLPEVQRYALDLRSLTQGRATFTMEVDHYEPLPGNLTQKVVEQHKAGAGA